MQVQHAEIALMHAIAVSHAEMNAARAIPTHVMTLDRKCSFGVGRSEVHNGSGARALLEKALNQNCNSQHQPAAYCNQCHIRRITLLERGYVRTSMNGELNQSFVNILPL